MCLALQGLVVETRLGNGEITDTHRKAVTGWTVLTVKEGSCHTTQKMHRKGDRIS